MFKIIKKGSNNFWHVFNNGAKNVSISDFEVVLDDVLNTFVIVLRNGANIPQIALSVLDIIVIDETASSVEETFLTASQLRARLVVLGYTAYLGAGNADSIMGLILEGTNVTITGTGTLADPYIINSSGGSGTTPTLNQVLVENNQTAGENILINDADAIELENGSLLKKGSYDFGGNGGISKICSVGYEDMWQSGIRHVFDNNGFIRNSTNCFNIVPNSSFDNTLRFKVGTIWTLDNGTSYVCTDNTTGSAVWDLVNINTPTLEEVSTEGNETTNPIIFDDGSGLKVETGVGGGGFAWYFKLLNIGTNFRQYFTNYSNTGDRTATLPDKDGTLAMLDDIPTTPDEVGALAVNGSNANSDVDLGNNSVLSKTFFVGEANKMNILADLLTDNRYARFQDKDYDGIADITDIPDVSNLVVKNTAITGATKTKITYDAKGLVTSGADATTADIADSTNKRYVTDANLTTIGNTSGTNTGDETTATIASKIGFLPYKFVQTSQTAHTGTISETIVATATITGGTFNSSDLMKAIFKATKTATTSNVTMRLRINTTNSLSGATTIATLSFTTANLYAKMKRDFDLNGGNLYAYSFTSSLASDDTNVNTLASSTPYNTANTLYFFWTLQLGTSGDSVVPNLANLTN